MNPSAELFQALIDTIAVHEPDCPVSADASARVMANLCDILGCMMSSLSFADSEDYDLALNAMKDRINSMSRRAAALKADGGNLQ